MNHWQEIDTTFRKLFDRQWYTNHGPLAQEFELALEELLGTHHAVCVANPAIGLTMALESLRLTEPVITLCDDTSEVRSALYWSRCSMIPVRLHQPDQQLGAVLCSSVEINHLELATDISESHDCPLIIDCSFNSSIQVVERLKKWFSNCNGFPGKIIMAVLSFQNDHAIPAQGAACIATSNNEQAEILRNIRSSYGVRKVVQVVKTANGRMSEAQAAFGLISLKQLNI